MDVVSGVCWEVSQPGTVGRKGAGQSTTLPPVSCLYRSSGGWEDELEEDHEGKEEESANVPTSRAPRLEGESKEAASSIAAPQMRVLLLPLPHPPTRCIPKARTSPPRFLLLSQGPGPFCLNPFLNLPLLTCS